MGWVIHNGFITSDDHAIGSIVMVGNKWLVEILWSGPTGDIKIEAESNTAALAFIKGAEKTFEAFTGSEAPWAATTSWFRSSKLSFGNANAVGLTKRGWIDGTDFTRVAKLKELAPDALRRLQAVDRKTFRTRQNEVFKAWIKGLIPKFDPDEKPFTPAQQADLLDWCEARQTAFFGACPSLAVEDALTATVHDKWCGAVA
jgi:hypothetical protein